MNQTLAYWWHYLPERKGWRSWLRLMLLVIEGSLTYLREKNTWLKCRWRPFGVVTGPGQEKFNLVNVPINIFVGWRSKFDHYTIKLTPWGNLLQIIVKEGPQYWQIMVPAEHLFRKTRQTQNLIYGTIDSQLTPKEIQGKVDILLILSDTFTPLTGTLANSPSLA